MIEGNPAINNRAIWYTINGGRQVWVQDEWTPQLIAPGASSTLNLKYPRTPLL